jgi:DNA-binding NarL/FixJ family response regulator
METKDVLLLDGQSGQSWIKALKKIVSSLGYDLVISSVKNKDHIPWPDFDLIIVDAGSISDLTATIKMILEKDPVAKIIVFTPTPKYKQAREVMLAGSADYIRKSHDERYLHEALTKILSNDRLLMALD